MSVILALHQHLEAHLPQPLWVVSITRQIAGINTADIILEYYYSTPSTEHEITITYNPENLTIKLTLWVRKEIDIALRREPRTEEIIRDLHDPNSLNTILQCIYSYLDEYDISSVRAPEASV